MNSLRIWIFCLHMSPVKKEKNTSQYLTDAEGYLGNKYCLT